VGYQRTGNQSTTTCQETVSLLGIIEAVAGPTIEVATIAADRTSLERPEVDLAGDSEACIA
jgi:hypothetical protein